MLFNESSIVIPATPISYVKPNDIVLESQKTQGWYLQQLRYYAYNFYNQPIPNAVLNNYYIANGMSTEMVRCFLYYYGNQTSEFYSAFDNIVPNMNGAGIKAPMIPDQTVRTYVEHQVGKIRQMIEPIEDVMSVKSLDYYSAIKRKEKESRLMAKLYFDKFKESNGVEYVPDGIASVETEEDIEAIIAKERTDVENNCLDLARGIYYEEDMKIKYESCALNETVGGLTMIFGEPYKNRLKTFVPPCYNLIWDNRSLTDFGEDDEVGGWVTYMSPAEIFSTYKEVFENEEQRNFIIEMAKFQNMDALQYYNTCPNITWWDASKGKCAVAKVYFLTLCNSRRQVVGKGKAVRNIDDDKEYQVRNDDGSQATMMGKDIKGDDYYEMWHEATLIGNAIAVRCGIVPYQPRDKKTKKPTAPFFRWAHRLNMNYIKSDVGRMTPYIDLKQSIEAKLKDLMDKDMGKNYILLADKLAEADIDPEQIWIDFKTKRHAVIKTSGQPNNPNENKRVASEEWDLSLQSDILQYYAYKKQIGDELAQMLNMPPAVIGNIDRTMGLGVTQQINTNATYSKLSFYKGMETFITKSMRGFVNRAKIMAVDYGQDMAYTTSDGDVKIISFDKREKYEDIGIYWEPLDEIEAENKAVFRQGVQSYGQNPTLEGAQALRDQMELLKAKTFNQGIQKLSKSIEKREVQQQQQVAAQQEQEGNIQAQLQSMKSQQELILQAFKEMNANWRESLKAATDGINQAEDRLIKQEEIKNKNFVSSNQ